METEKNILSAIAYFDMFQYPVLLREIHMFINIPLSVIELETVINRLVTRKKIFRLDEFYSLRNDYALVEQRRKGNERAGHLLPIAFRIGKFINKFPFVKGVGISGSLSKDFANEEADIDFFIITESNRLWIARSLLHALKKLSFLFGKQHWLCMNYFIDEDALELAEKNIFIATEVVTLKPVIGNAVIRNFFRVNNWTHAHFPNYKQDTSFIDLPKSRGKQIPVGGGLTMFRR
ncbi:MAG: nucleotidyltransferase domain-containing protein, partial [Sediminibacterium sp.]